MSYYRSYWKEFESGWFIYGSVGYSITWWGFKPIDIGADFHYKDVDVSFHIGPFTAHISVGKEEK